MESANNPEYESPHFAEEGMVVFIQIRSPVFLIIHEKCNCMRFVVIHIYLDLYYLTMYFLCCIKYHLIRNRTFKHSIDNPDVF